MPVPATIDDLSTTAGDNSPSGSETPKDGDNYLRTLGAFIALLRDKLDGTSNTGTVKNPVLDGTATGSLASAALSAITFSGTHTFSSGNLISGTYTPTLTNGTNVSSSSSAVCQWLRVGNTVTVSGRISVTHPSGVTPTDIGVSFPVASAITLAIQCAGTAVSSDTVSTLAGEVYGDATNDRATILYTSASAGANALTFQFTYLVV
jgi:hypothetical protein